MDAVVTLKALVARLEGLTETKEIEALRDWVARGGIESLRPGIEFYLEQKLAFPDAVKRYTFLHGPISFTIHVSKKWKKVIAVMGDEHVTPAALSLENKDKAIDVATYLKGIVEAALAPIDFYVEVGYLSADKLTRHATKDSPLSHVRDAFEVCLTREKKGCPYKHLRAHYIDVRSSAPTSYGDLYRALHKVSHYITTPGKAKQLRDQVVLLRTLLEEIHPTLREELTDSKHILAWAGTVFNLPRITKQVNAISNVGLRATLVAYIDQLIQGALAKYGPDVLTYNTLLQATRGLLDAKALPRDAAAYRNTLLKSASLLLHIGIIYVDYYALARMFRSFRQVEEVPSSDPTHIITYAGDAHAEHYRGFLRLLGFETTYQAKPTGTFQLLDISAAPTPLFS
ncbi:Hypothetical protein POVN_LOCUS549 [uncultured virus]|nr:Hypothetical protein POVN_LOCUS549 [uncultured virus]